MAMLITSFHATDGTLITNKEGDNMDLEAMAIDRAIHRLSRPWINDLAEWQHWIREA